MLLGSYVVRLEYLAAGDDLPCRQDPGAQAISFFFSCSCTVYTLMLKSMTRSFSEFRVKYRMFLKEYLDIL